jgi:hypothetical protein
MAAGLMEPQSLGHENPSSSVVKGTAMSSVSTKDGGNITGSFIVIDTPPTGVDLPADDIPTFRRRLASMMRSVTA